MTEESKAFLEAHRYFVESYSQENVPRHMNMRDRERLLKIMNEELGYDTNPDLWCPDCLKSFVLNSYQIYDQYLANEAGQH